MASTASPTLKLVIQKGPRNGETLEFNPNSTIRIGRVVRGNNLPIKDAGISSKHLSIEFNSDSGKWVITDLDSSNGTILNSSQLKPLCPHELRNGNEIKIGELTSIRVEIVGISGAICQRRNPRRQAASKGGIDLGAKAEVVDEKCPNLGEGGSVRVPDPKGEDVQKGVDSGVNLGRETRKGRGRGRAKKENVLADGDAENAGDVGVNAGVEDVKPKQECGMGTRRTRSSRREGHELLSLAEPVPVRRTRNMRNVEKASANEATVMGNCKEVESVAESRKTRGRGRKKELDVECSDNLKDVILEDKTSREASQLEALDVRELPPEEPVGDSVQQYVFEGKVTRETSPLEVPDAREPPHEEPVGDTLQQRVVEAKRTVEVPEPEAQEQMGGELHVKGQPCEQPMDNAAQENDKDVAASHFEQDTCHRLESDTVLEDDRVEKTETGEVSEALDTEANGGDEDQEACDVPDLEKMTLGEWFDYLEVYLPKQIHAVTDEIIMDMRKRAKQFDDFMLQQQKERGKLPITTEDVRS